MNEIIYKKDEIASPAFVMSKRAYTFKSKPLSLHWHDCYEIIRCGEKTASASFDGIDVTLDAGDAVLIQPGSAHDLGPGDPSAYVQIIQFYPRAEYSPDGRRSGSMNSILCSRHYKSGGVVIRGGEAYSEKIAFLCAEIDSELSRDDPSEDILSGAARMLTGYFFHDKADTLLKTDENFDIERICRYIDDHLYEKINLETTAGDIGYSASYFSHKFREITGIGFKAHIDQLKMREARRMLGEGKSAREVSAALGYDSVQNFSRVFKRINRTTPSALIRNGNS